MKPIWFSATLSIFLIALFVVSVSAQGYPPEVIVIAPPLVIVTGNVITGTLALVYPAGGPVTLNPPDMKIRACGSSGCVTITVSINPDGTWSLPITSGFPTGTVTLFIVANSMTDSFGATFPSVDTEIGVVTLTAPAPAKGGVPSPAYTSQPPTLFRVAGQMVQQSQVSFVIVGVLGILIVAGAVIILVPRKKTPEA